MANRSSQLLLTILPYVHIISTRQCVFIHVHPNPLLDLLTSDQTVLEALQSTYIHTCASDLCSLPSLWRMRMLLSGSNRASVARDLQGINPLRA